MPESTAVKQPVGQVRWEPLKEVVYRELRDAIVAAMYPPGTALTVRATAEAMGVSPMPVRSAFDRLVAERVVEASSSGTVRIPRMSRRRFTELVEMRTLLEGQAAEAAAGRAGAADIVALRSLAQRLAEAAQTDDSAAYLLLNREFKFTVYRLSGSAVLVDLIERVWLQIAPFLHFYGAGVREQSGTDQYDAIVAALAAGDGPAARAATVRDIVSGAEFLLATGEFAD
ncbi:glutamyl-tRNA(Gln) amidotransferase subunit A [Mycolicibacterium phlei]|nr:HTH-type transcriptional regulator McbR [Mycolicibacterium phlei]STZ22060.1 glutamyl-tRNA(Gln) amidotransferase subunit A [Mycolicibacterium phlei]VEG11697.1 glutamyl-tRNA(Gln) amidotransferase subunit A [Mycobacteroides chelonae]